MHRKRTCQSSPATPHRTFCWNQSQAPSHGGRREGGRGRPLQCRDSAEKGVCGRVTYSAVSGNTHFFNVGDELLEFNYKAV